MWWFFFFKYYLLFNIINFFLNNFNEKIIYNESNIIAFIYMKDSRQTRNIYV